MLTILTPSFRPLFLAFFAIIISLLACNSTPESEPDLSQIELTPVKILRFDRSIMRIPTNSLAKAQNYLQTLSPQEQAFLTDYLANILGLAPAQSTNPETLQQLLSFVKSYQKLYQRIEPSFSASVPELENQLTLAFKYLKYYFPQTPTRRVLTFVAPLDAVFSSSFGITPDIINDSVLGISVLLHNADSLHTNSGQSLLRGVHESYIVRRFSPQTIVGNVMKNIIDDIFPDSSQSATLLEQMIERGKRYYLLHKLLPQTQDSLLFNYTATQIRGCFANEASIWQRLKTLDVLYKRDNLTLRGYLGDAPFTPALSQQSPGNIGAFLGFRIVQTYMRSHKKKSLPELMKTPALDLFKKSKYKPKNKKIK